MIRFALPLALGVAACSAAQAAPATPGAAAFEYGYFCALDPVDEAVAEGTISGTVSFVQGPPPFLRTGPLVPAQIGIGFGVHVRALPEFAGPVTVYIEHPPMGPNGVTRQVWVTELSSEDQDYLGYSFDYDYELVTGAWRMSAEAEGRTVYAADFEVLDPAVMPPSPCGNVPLS